MIYAVTSIFTKKFIVLKFKVFVGSRNAVNTRKKVHGLVFIFTHGALEDEAPSSSCSSSSSSSCSMPQLVAGEAAMVEVLGEAARSLLASPTTSPPPPLHRVSDRLSIVMGTLVKVTPPRTNKPQIK